jgi:hypothetical protein
VEGTTSIVFSAIILPPFLLTVVALNLVFPKNVLKISALFSVPLAFVTVFTFNLPIIGFVFWFSLRSSILPQNIPSFLLTRFFESLTDGFILGSACVAFWIWPAILVYFIALYLREAWTTNRRLAARLEALKKGPIEENGRAKIRYNLTAQFVERFILHPLAVLTSYDPSREELMLDIRTTDGFLFSGKFGRYFLDGKNLSGISIHNVVKYDLRDPAKNPSYYLIPNNGELHFFKESVADMHFWKLRVGTVMNIHLRDKQAATKLAWLCSLQYALPNLKLKLVAYLRDKTGAEVFSTLNHDLAKSGLRHKDVKIEFRQLVVPQKSK